MSIRDRAAQFAPFSALTGHKAAISETARLTDKKIKLNEDDISVLNKQIHIIEENIGQQPEVTVTYFVPDKKKSGGAYADYTGKVRRIDHLRHSVIMADGFAVDIGEILKIECSLFENPFGFE